MNMNYEEFKERVQEELKDYLGNGYENVEVIFRDALKVNQTLEQLSIMGIPGHENASPSIPVNAVYEDYLKKDSFEEAMEHLADTVKEAVRRMPHTPIKDGHLDMNDVEIPIPDISVQREIVNIHKCYIERQRIAEALKEQLKNICPVLIRGV